jgi:hypothetical protein
MWYYELDGAKFGPVDAETIAALIRAGKISETTRVRRLNTDEWKFLDETDLIWVLQDSLEETEEEEAYEDFLTDEDELDLEDVESEDEVADVETWYYMLEDQLYGPVTVDELLLMRDEGMVDLSVQISRDGQSGWAPMVETELAGLQRDTNEEEVD